MENCKGIRQESTNNRLMVVGMEEIQHCPCAPWRDRECEGRATLFLKLSSRRR